MSIHRPRGASVAPILLCFLLTSVVPRAAQVAHRHAGAVAGHVHPWQSSGASDLSHLLAHLAHGGRDAAEHDETVPHSHASSGVHLVYADGRLEIEPLRAEPESRTAPEPGPASRAKPGPATAHPTDSRDAKVASAATPEGGAAHTHWQSPYQVVARTSAPAIAAAALVVATATPRSARDASAARAAARARAPPRPSLS
jgi:hypothetical protein